MATPWHHDQSYYPVDGEDIVSLWIPVDPVPKEACVTFVEGSHRWGKWFVPRLFATDKEYAKLMRRGLVDRWEHFPKQK